MYMVRHRGKYMDLDTVSVCDPSDRRLNDLLLFEFAKHLVAIFCGEFDVPKIYTHFVGILS
jgi:hypothetical protein